MKLIDLHKEWMESGKIKDRENSFGDGGLCNAVPIKYYDAVSLFRPKRYKISWWAGGHPNQENDKLMYDYNSLRQTIVLLICAINNEL